MHFSFVFLETFVNFDVVAGSYVFSFNEAHLFSTKYGARGPHFSKNEDAISSRNEVAFFQNNWVSVPPK